MVHRENYLYPFLDFAGEVGGYFGLLMGISFLDFVVELKRWFSRVQSKPTEGNNVVINVRPKQEKAGGKEIFSTRCRSLTPVEGNVYF